MKTFWLLGALFMVQQLTHAADTTEYTGSAACARCHVQEAAAWSRSHHALAMQPATDETVLGDFDGVELRAGNDRAQLARRDGQQFVITTTGPDGSSATLAITHTLGLDPLQQYLVALPGGRLQALPWAWDSRPLSTGGQRWFHLYADEPPLPGTPLHWSGRNQNWNHMCAACHVTGYQKRYNANTHRYSSYQVELGVGCEGCHGPGAGHAAAAAAGKPAPLPATLVPRAADAWHIDPATGNATPLHQRADAEIELCAQCHARRQQIAEGAAGSAFFDNYAPILLERGNYHVDGQILGEVFEYGSFLQSRMYRAGVACSDCHEPHALRLRAEGDGLCLRCHDKARYATRAHRLHEQANPGARCVACHMPERTYMRVDDRRDHSLRVPRPDLSVAFGVPNACDACHADRGARWAAERLAKRSDPVAGTRTQIAVAFDTGWRLASGARAKLARLTADSSFPVIVRASALAALERLPGPTAVRAAADAVESPEPLMRLGALRALASYPAEELAGLVAPRLADPFRAVRIEAARRLAGTPLIARPAGRRALAELEAAQRLNADRPEAWLDRGNVVLAQGNTDAAAAAFTQALAIAPDFVPARVNLSDLYRALGREADAERLLREGLVIQPDAAALHHALGLLLVRRGARAEGTAAIAQAAQLAPDDPHLAYVHGIAILSNAGAHAALEVLERAQARFPADLDILYALATISRDAGACEDARHWTATMLEEEPGDRRARALLSGLDVGGCGGAEQ